MRLLHYTCIHVHQHARTCAVTDTTVNLNPMQLYNNFFLQIVAACDFYMCIGHIQKGIMKSDGEWVCPHVCCGRV